MELEFVYIVYSRHSQRTPDTGIFRRVYASMEKAQQYVNKKNSESKRYFFWIAEPVIG